MNFEPKYYGEGGRLHIINPAGDVGFTPLWNIVGEAEKMLVQAGVDLSPETSRIAVMANLYGNGLPQMLRNLLWNPQIRHVVIAGQNLSGSREHLINFFRLGLEEVEFLGVRSFRIKNTSRIIDNGVLPEYFCPLLTSFTVFGNIGNEETKKGFGRFFQKSATARAGTCSKSPGFSHS